MKHRDGVGKGYCFCTYLQTECVMQSWYPFNFKTQEVSEVSGLFDKDVRSRTAGRHEELQNKGNPGSACNRKIGESTLLEVRKLSHGLDKMKYSFGDNRKIKYPSLNSSTLPPPSPLFLFHQPFFIIPHLILPHLRPLISPSTATIVVSVAPV